MRRFVLGLFCALLIAGPVAAVLPEEQLADPVLEARARETMVFLAINGILCAGIIASTGGAYDRALKKQKFYY